MNFCLEVVKFWCFSNVYPNPDIIFILRSRKNLWYSSWFRRWCNTDSNPKEWTILYYVNNYIYNLYQYFFSLCLAFHADSAQHLHWSKANSLRCCGISTCELLLFPLSPTIALKDSFVPSKIYPGKS